MSIKDSRSGIGMYTSSSILSLSFVGEGGIEWIGGPNRGGHRRRLFKCWGYMDSRNPRCKHCNFSWDEIKSELAQLRLTLPQEMTEQLTTLRRSSGDLIPTTAMNGRAHVRVRVVTQRTLLVPLAFRTGCCAYHSARRNNREMAASRWWQRTIQAIWGAVFLWWTMRQKLHF